MKERVFAAFSFRLIIFGAFLSVVSAFEKRLLGDIYTLNFTNTTVSNITYDVILTLFDLYLWYNRLISINFYASFS